MLNLKKQLTSIKKNTKSFQFNRNFCMKDIIFRANDGIIELHPIRVTHWTFRFRKEYRFDSSRFPPANWTKQNFERNRRYVFF